MDRQTRPRDTVFVKSREMKGRSQTLPWWRGEGVKTTENKNIDLVGSQRGHSKNPALNLLACMYFYIKTCFAIILGDARPVKQSGNPAGASPPTAAAVSPPSSAKLRYFREVMALPRNHRINKQLIENNAMVSLNEMPFHR
jgi:hypothetical protein